MTQNFQNRKTKPKDWKNTETATSVKNPYLGNSFLIFFLETKYRRRKKFMQKQVRKSNLKEYIVQVTLLYL